MAQFSSNPGLESTRLDSRFVSAGRTLNINGLYMKPSANLSPVEDGAHEEHLPEGITETEDEKKNHWFVGSIDQGTTSSRFLIFNGEGDSVASHQIEFENLYPKSGYGISAPHNCGAPR